MSTGDSWKLFEHGFSQLLVYMERMNLIQGLATWPDNSLRWSKESTEGCARDSRGQSVLTRGLWLKLSGKSSLFSRIVSCENDVSLRNFGDHVNDHISFMRVSPKLGKAGLRQRTGNFLITYFSCWTQPFCSYKHF